jgi:hypothetical protein
MLTTRSPRWLVQFSKLEPDRSGGSTVRLDSFVSVHSRNSLKSNVTAGNQGTLWTFPKSPTLTRSVWECSNATSERKPQIRMATIPATPRPQIAKRRSTRIALNTSIGLSGHDRQECPFTMPAKATNLNRHGAAIQLPRQLLVGSTVMVRNARGTQVSARVVAQLAVSQGLSIYGIEFLQQDDTTNSFWGITFPALEGRTSGAQAADQIGIARRRRGMQSLQSQLS